MRTTVLDPDGYEVHREDCRDCGGRFCSVCAGDGTVKPAGCHCNLCEAEDLRDDERKVYGAAVHP